MNIHNHHDRLLRDLREQSAIFAADPSENNGARLMALLRDDLLRHAEGEQRELYPVIDRLIRTTGARATDAMQVDHEFIGEYVDWIEAALHSLPGATGSHRDLLLSQLRRYLVQLEAVLNIHLEKEERLFLPMIEHNLRLTDQLKMVAAMRGNSGAAGHQTLGDGKLIPGKLLRKKETARKAGDKRLVRGKRHSPHR